MQKDGWKLILPHSYRTLPDGKGGDGGLPAPYKNVKAGLELYHLNEDIYESSDLAASHSEKVKELMKYAEEARAELGDNLTKRTGSGTRKPGQLTDDEVTALEKIHWPEGRKKAEK